MTSTHIDQRGRLFAAEIPGIGAAGVEMAAAGSVKG